MLIHQEDCQGTFELSASVNGRPTWTSQPTATAIWYVQDQNIWIIGELILIGKPKGSIFTVGTLFGANENGKWNSSIENAWKKLDTNDFSIECIARKGTNQQ